MATSGIKAETGLEVGMFGAKLSLCWVVEHKDHLKIKKELLLAFAPSILKLEILHSCEILSKSLKQSTEYVRTEFEGLRNDSLNVSSTVFLCLELHIQLKS